MNAFCCPGVGARNPLLTAARSENASVISTRAANLPLVVDLSWVAQVRIAGRDDCLRILTLNAAVGRVGACKGSEDETRAGSLHAERRQ